MDRQGPQAWHGPPRTPSRTQPECGAPYAPCPEASCCRRSQMREHHARRLCAAAGPTCLVIEPFVVRAAVVPLSSAARISRRRFALRHRARQLSVAPDVFRNSRPFAVTPSVQQGNSPSDTLESRPSRFNSSMKSRNSSRVLAGGDSINGQLVVSLRQHPFAPAAA